MDEEGKEITTVADEYEARPYQIQLLEAAIDSNTIVQLGTGAGKTFIAVMLIKQLSATTFKPFSDEGAKRTIFLVNTVPLVSQQSEYIEKHTPLKVGRYWGEMGVDDWQAARWCQEFDTHNILVMTRQIFLDALSHRFIHIAKINLIVFDECHHAVKNDPYVRIMKEFYFNCPREDRPHILGLTASIISGKCKPGDLTIKVKELEEKLDCRTETASDLEEVAKYATNPEEALVTYDSGSLVQEILQIKSNMEDLLTFFNESCSIHKRSTAEKDIRNIIEECLAVLNDVSISMAIEVAENAEKELNDLRDEQLSEWEEGLVAVALTGIKIFSGRCKKSLGDTNTDNHSPKFTKLLHILSNVVYHDDTQQEKLCGIIFVQKRSTAVCLSNTINSLSKEYFPQIRSDFIVGHGSIKKTVEQGSSSSSNMNIKKQQLVLKKFRNESINLLVATSVVEEGLDVRKCNLVVRYDFPQTFQSYVQSKGRARSKNSQYRLLIDIKEYCNCETKLGEYRRNEVELQSICHDRTVPEEDEIEIRLKGHCPPFIPLGEDGPRLTVDGSLSLLHKYCQKLPHDQFTLSAPDFDIRKLDEGGVCYLDGEWYPTLFIVTVCLPMNCPIKDKVEGPALPSLKLSRKAAALQTIEELYRKKELDDHLKPVSHKEIDSDDEDDVKIERKKQCNAGTKKEKMYYRNEVASCLINSHLLAGSSYNLLYVFLMRCKDTKEYYRCRNQLEIKTAGILTSKPLPYNKIPNFSLYLRKTEVIVSMYRQIVSSVNDSDLKRYQSFQEALFNKVLKMSHFKADSEASQGYLVVPVSVICATAEPVCYIDDDIINHVITYGDNQPVKPKQPFNHQDFKNALVSKSYTKDIAKGQARLYKVIRINVSITPQSSCQHNPSITYAQYFDTKYNCQIKYLNQFSVVCKPISSDNEKSLKLTATRYKQTLDEEDKHNSEILLFPELCNIHPLKADTLFLFRCVPSLLHRMESLLLIDEFSNSIINKTGIGLLNNGTFYTLATTITNVSANQHNLGGTCTACYFNYPHDNDSKPVSIDMMDLEGVIRSPDSGLLLQAITPVSAKDCIDLERLEVLGDSFLKLATSINLFCSPIRNNHHEGKLSMARQRRISNFNLWYLACKKDIPGKILSKFEPSSSWIPSCVMPLNTAAKPSSSAQIAPGEKHLYHRISDKGVADAVEALLGAYIIAGGIKAGFKFLQFLDLKMDYPSNEDVVATSCKEVTMKTSPSQESLMSMGRECDILDDIIPLLIQNSTYILPLYCCPFPPAILKEGDHTDALNKISLTCSALSEKLQWEFKDKGLLLQALTHPSYIKNDLTNSYQRLEFLGDAILDYLITCYIYGKFPKYSPGKVTEMRSALVNNVTFAEIAVKELELHKHLLHTSPPLFGQIAEYSDWLEKVWKKNEEEKKSVLLCRSIAYETKDRVVHLDPATLQPSLEQSMSLESVEYEETMMEEEPQDTLLIDEVDEIDPPKALGDILESIVGALFLDCDMSLEIVWLKVYQFFQPLIEKYGNEGLPIPPIKELYDTGHSIEIGATKSESKDGNKRYRCTVKVIDKRVQVSAVAKTLKMARKAAARRALKMLKMLEPQPPHDAMISGNSRNGDVTNVANQEL